MSENFDSVMRELESLGTARTRKSYLSRGVREPLFGVATGALKPLKKRIGLDQPLAEELWSSGNYDAMYLAGMIADVHEMSAADFDRWMDDAYGPMVSDFVVAVTLAESDLAEDVARAWIAGDDDERAAAGWACYQWLLGWRPDESFDDRVIGELLDLAGASIGDATPRLNRAMNSFVVAVGVSYRPLHEEALRVADRIDPVEVPVDGSVKPLPSAAAQIRKASDAGKIGFKRRAVRC